ncbi:cytochrome P450 2L1, partial [Armadillidium vulgare]
IVSTNGPHWHEIRRFSLRHLRDLGMGKSKIVSAMQYEAMELVNHMKKQAGTPAPFPNVLTMAVINVLWQMVASKRFDFDDETVLELHHEMEEAQKSFSRLALLDIFPWIQSIFPEALINIITLKYKLKIVSDKSMKRFQSYIDEHKKTLDENNPRDYIDEYLIEMKRQESQTDSTMITLKKDLAGCIGDLFAAGLETTSLTTIWAVFYLATFPKVQQKVHKEIDSVLSNGILVTHEDKSRLPYMEAFVSEVLRYSSLVANGVPHTVHEDVKLRDYIIPKDSVIFTTTEAIHSDLSYFESPEEFRPERFLTAEGKFNAPREGFFPFGVGKRQCIGESLARMELFIFLTTLAQNFSFSSPPGKKIDISPAEIPIINKPRVEQDIMITIRI